MHKRFFTWLVIVTVFISCSEETKKTSVAVKTRKKAIDKSSMVSFLDESKAPFYFGVASGDPLPDAVIIWTKIIPKYHGNYPIQWEMASDSGFKQIVKSGKMETDSSKNYTVKVDVIGLNPGTYYYYRFTYNGKKSPMGRTKTAGDSTTSEVRLAFASCSNFAWGYFNAYSVMADDTLDAVVHLGDYIYEHEQKVYQHPTVGRNHLPNKELISIVDYRLRYAQYRSDNDLQKVHAAHPFITIWDDHEIANNAYDEGAGNHQQEEGDWKKRLSAAKQVYYEWMPVRENNDKLYRSFTYGKLVNLVMLDTRVHGRTIQVSGVNDPHYNDADRKIIDDEQMQWLKQELQKETQWRFIGNQVLLGSMNVFFSKKGELYMDGWDGYPVQRNNLMELLSTLKNVVVVTGDFHSSFILDNLYKNKKVATEFVVPSISSANYDEDFGIDSAKVYQDWYLNGNKNLKACDLINHGYTRFVITKDLVQSNYIFVETVTTKEFKSFSALDLKIKQ